MSDYHKRHEPYIAAVAAAFDAAGITALDFYADPNDPRDGSIQIAPVGDYVDFAEVWVGWQEDRGWHLVPYVDGPEGMKASFVIDLPAERIASPWTVVDHVTDVLGVPHDVQPDAYPDVDFPDHVQDDDEDPEFEAALAVYAGDGAR